VAFADLSGVEAVYARAVLQKVEDLAADRRREQYKAFQVAVQNGVARAFKG
jgi:hypothetical protein